jgi:branched-chain amino acid aminotransferase
LKIQNNIKEHTELNYESSPSFGTVHVPILLWFEMDKHEGSPKEVFIDSLSAMKISPFNSTLHYGQSIFEGLKAFRLNDSEVGIFRPKLNAERFERSAKIMSMADFSPELFMNCLIEYVKACKKYVPSEPGHSLYLRPLLIANDPVIKVKSSKNYRFVIMSSIVGPYFKKNAKGSKVLINKSFIRAFPGGTGEAKTAANYAMSLPGLEYAQSIGFDQVLYLDAMKKEKLEELGGMNFFMVKNGELYTPKLDGQILHGITRRSILEIATSIGIKCHESDVLLSNITSGQAEEVFAVGTAASVSSIAELGLQEKKDSKVESYKFESTVVANKLRQILLDTQTGKTEFSKSWMHVL